MIKVRLYSLCGATVALGLLFAPVPHASAGQIITLDNVILPATQDIYGNGDQPNGAVLANNPVNLTNPPDSNSVELKNGSQGRNVYGGYGASSSATSASATGNSITLGSSTINALYGGYATSTSTGNATAANNTVTINSGATVKSTGYGGYAAATGASTGNATTTGNTVKINDGATINTSLYGGYAGSQSGSSAATNNTIEMTGGTAKGGLTGGYANGATAGAAEASGNTVAISGGTVSASVTTIAGGQAQTVSGAGQANRNTVTISGSAVLNVPTQLTLYGGYAISTSSGNVTAEGNTVSVENGGTVNGGNIFGGRASTSSGTAASNGNTVTVSNGSKVTAAANGFGSVYGGYASTTTGTAAEASNNTVTIDGAEVSNSLAGNGNVYGGVVTGSPASAAAANGNTVTISNSSKLTGAVTGGSASSSTKTAKVSGNSVTVTGGSTVGTSAAAGNVNVAAASTGNAEVTGNSLTISGAGTTVSANSYGGYARMVNITTYAATGTATATGNSVTVANGGKANADVYGAYAVSDIGTATASANSAAVNSGTVAGKVYGGRASSGAGAAIASNNTLTINGGTTGGNVTVSYADDNTDDTTASANSVAINIGMITGSAYGGQATSGAGAAIASNNTLAIDGGTISGDVTGGYAGSNTDTTASANSVAINSGMITGSVYGGKTSSSAGAATANSNTLTIDGSTTGGDVTGGYAGGNTDATASNNSVAINSGTVTGSLYGGQVYSYIGAATANGNTLAIDGGTISGDVIGGYADGNANSTAIGNTVTISGHPLFGPSTILAGGITTNGGNAVSGNTLNFHAAGVTVASFQNFEFLNFYVPSTAGNGDVMLKVNGVADITGANNNGVTVSVGLAGASTPLKIGDHVVLIDADQLNWTSTNHTANGYGMLGVTMRYAFDILTPDTGSDPNQLWAILRKASVSEDKNLSEGFLSGTALLNQGADLIAGWGMSAAMRVDDLTDYGVFAVVSGGASRYDTGSHTDLSSISLMTGLSEKAALESGNLVLGAFFEYGNGSYDTYTVTHGDGDIYHVGGGILGRMDFTGSKTGHFYGEGSVRAGNVHNSYTNTELRDFSGVAASYDSSSAYYGIHLSVGYLWSLTNKASLDLYGKYFWTYQDGDTFRLTTGDPMDFDSVNSHRLRLGTRFNYAVSETISPYVGVAYEQEFDGNARATAYGFSMNSPSLSGGTAMAELGLTRKPSKSLPLLIDLGIQGYTGTREGVAGTLRLHYDF